MMIRLTTKGAFGDVGSFEVDDEDEEDPLLKSLEKAPCLQIYDTSYRRILRFT